MTELTTSAAPAKLRRAVEVFAELGWLDATPNEAVSRPLGSAEQRRIAKTGLASGEWGVFAALDPATFGWQSFLGAAVNETVLALFAVRVGVSAQRAVALLRSARGIDDAAIVHVVRERGPAYAGDFAARASGGSGRMWLDASSRLGSVSVRLVHDLELPIPASLDYLRDWAVFALGDPANRGWVQPPEREPVPAEMLAPRFTEHLREAVALGLSVTGPLGALLPAALERGWLTESEALAAALSGLDAAQRPGDRKVWAAFLTEQLGLTRPERTAELLRHADALVSAIATGDAGLAEAFGPSLIEHADADILRETLELGLASRTKKAKRALLAAAARRPAPENATELAALLTPLADGRDRDRDLARAATAVLDAWGIRGERAPEAPAESRGRWVPTPELWSVPRFDVGEASPAALTAAAAALTGLPESTLSTPEAERLLALANQVAAADAAAARTALRGVRAAWVPGIRGIAEWCASEPLPMLDRPPHPGIPGSSPTHYSPVPARDAAVLQRLGEVPALLSTPSWDDLRIDPVELRDRLRAYAASGAAASEADLFLALLRTDRLLLTPELLGDLEALRVPVLLQDGSEMATAAGPAAVRYFADPVVEPARVLDPERHWWAPSPFVAPASLAEFPPRLRSDVLFSGLELDALPGGGDGVGTGIAHSDLAGLGRDLRQLVRRATPLTPGLAINLIGAQRGFHERAIADGALAISEAWERGLLRPGVPDVALLDWQETPGKLAAFAHACLDLADEGLLSLVWPLLDACVVRSNAAPRRLSGTAELLEAIGELLPTVQHAVRAGVASAEALALPGTRAIAGAGGASRAVQRAREIVARLPEPAPDPDPSVGSEPATRPERSTAPAPASLASSGQGPDTGAAPGPAAAPPAHGLDDAAFAAFWPQGRETRATVDDGARITARWHDPAASTRLLEIELLFSPECFAETPEAPRRFRTRTSWFYDIEHEGQCGMTEILPGVEDIDPAGREWLRWDPEAGGIRVSPHRDWRGGSAGPLRRDGEAAAPAVGPLTTGMIAVLISGMQHDNGHGFTVREAVRSGLLDAAGVQRAVQQLLESADFTPVKLAGMIEAEPDTLGTLWPVLVEGIRAGAGSTPPPRWLNRVLDAALLRAPALRAAAERGAIPPAAAAWPGLAELAERKGSQAALVKARALRAELLG